MALEAGEDQSLDTLMVQFVSPKDPERRVKYCDWVAVCIRDHMPGMPEDFEIHWVDVSVVPNLPNSAVVQTHKRMHPLEGEPSRAPGVLTYKGEPVDIKPERSLLRRIRRYSHRRHS